MTVAQRERITQALQHVRAAMLACKQGAPPLPALDAAEKQLLLLLFTEEEVNAYLRSPGAQVYR